MKYTLITKTGKVMVFNLKQCAEIFQSAYGGTLVATIPCEVNINRIKESV